MLTIDNLTIFIANLVWSRLDGHGEAMLLAACSLNLLQQEIM